MARQVATAAEAMGPETAEQSTDTHVRQKAEALRTMVASGPCRGGAHAGVGRWHCSRHVHRREEGGAWEAYLNWETGMRCLYSRSPWGRSAVAAESQGGIRLVTQDSTAHSRNPAYNSRDDPREWGSQREDPAVVL